MGKKVNYNVTCQTYKNEESQCNCICYVCINILSARLTCTFALGRIKNVYILLILKMKRFVEIISIYLMEKVLYVNIHEEVQHYLLSITIV